MTLSSLKTVIDGYNLLHQTPVMQSGSGPTWLHQQRSNLIHELAKLLTPAERVSTICVFDAHTDRSPNTTDFVLEDIRVCFAHHHREADDFIEDLIDQHRSPRSLLVVSSDRRIRNAAKYRQAQTIDSRDWYEKISLRYTDSRNHATSITKEIDPESIKNTSIMEHEVDAWVSYLEMEKISVNKSPEDHPAPKPKAAPKLSKKSNERKASPPNKRSTGPTKKVPKGVSKRAPKSSRNLPESKPLTADESGIDPKILKRANRKLPEDGPLFPEDYFDGIS
ncbi:MAG: NYN domain-containing protein [Planctomycetota bacterium]|nr:NYN domain-containing protein [Planctomycetota bacterium]